MDVPLLDLRPQFAALEPEIRAAIDGVLADQRFILGPQVSAFEEALAQYCGTPHAIGVSSGTDALLCTLMALDIGPGDEVIVPTFTFFGTAGVVARLGATPVFVDSEPDTFNIDPRRVAEAITPRTRAIIPVHLYGQCADMEPICRLARDNEITVIEDAAQAFGATHHGTRAGCLADVACFSFFPSKNLGAFGDAGAVVTADDRLAETIRALRMHGETTRYHHARVGGNFRLDALQAAILAVKLPHVDTWNAERRRVAERWNQRLADTPLTTPTVRDGNEHVFHQYVVRTPDRDGLQDALRSAGIASAVYYPVPLHRQACFDRFRKRAGSCPIAEAAAEEVLALPIYPDLSPDVQTRVADEIRRFFAPTPARATGSA